MLTRHELERDVKIIKALEGIDLSLRTLVSVPDHIVVMSRERVSALITQAEASATALRLDGDDRHDVIQTLETIAASLHNAMEGKQ